MPMGRDPAAHRRLRPEGRRHGVLENNLTRKGIWATDGGRGAAAPRCAPHRDVFVVETDDIVGHLVMESSLGRLTVHKMETVSWILAKWLEREAPEDPTVEFTLAELARDFGVRWGGSRARSTKGGAALPRPGAILGGRGRDQSRRSRTCSRTALAN